MVKHTIPIEADRCTIPNGAWNKVVLPLEVHDWLRQNRFQEVAEGKWHRTPELRSHRFDIVVIRDLRCKKPMFRVTFDDAVKQYAALFKLAFAGRQQKITILTFDEFLEIRIAQNQDIVT